MEVQGARKIIYNYKTPTILECTVLYRLSYGYEDN